MRWQRLEGCSALHAVESLLNDDIASAHATEPRSARVRTSVGCFHALVVRVKVERKVSQWRMYARPEAISVLRRSTSPNGVEEGGRGA